MAKETAMINSHLLLMNMNKIYTINSQPRCNGIKSIDPVFGWGPPNGYIYQKAYYEFFVDKSLIKPLIEYLQKYQSITYQAVNKEGDHFSNVKIEDVNAVTWAIFPG